MGAVGGGVSGGGGGKKRTGPGRPLAAPAGPGAACGAVDSG